MQRGKIGGGKEHVSDAASMAAHFDAKAGKRKWLVILGGGFAVVWAIGILAELSKPEATRKAEATAEASAEAATQKAEAASAAQAAEGVWEQVRVMTSLCQQGSDQIAKEAGEGADANRLYEIANRTKSECGSLRLKMVELDPPEGVKGPLRDNFKAALNECRNGANLRFSAITKLGNIIDGKDRPSEVQSYKDTQGFADAAQAKCETMLQASVEAVGGKVPQSAQ